MSDRNLVTYEEERLEDGPHWRLMIDRSSAGQPGLFFTISFDSVDASLPHQEMTVVVDDGVALLTPVIRWLQELVGAVRVECETCGWYCQNRDPSSVRRAGVVHSTMLKPGHVVKEVAPK